MAAIPVTITGMMAYTNLEVGGGPVVGGGGSQPPSIWPSPGYPAHPIAPGGPPPGIWPSPGYPAHPIVLPPEGGPPTIWPSPGRPSHPIYFPPPPAPEGPPQGEGRWGWVDPPGVWVWVPASPGKPQPPAA